DERGRSVRAREPTCDRGLDEPVRLRREVSMIRIIAAVAGGLIAWFVVATISNLGIRLSWPEYVAVEKAMAFTLPMLLSRLAVGALASLCAGAITAWVARGHASGGGWLRAPPRR